MKNTFSALLVKSLMLTVIAFSLTACGVNYVRKDADPMKDNERVGILVARYDVMRPTLLKDVVISQKLNTIAAEKTGEELKGAISQKGMSAVVIPAEKELELVKAYMAVPRFPHHTMDKPAEMALGDLREKFQKYGIDYLLVYEADSIVSPTAVAKLAGTATTATISLLTGVISSAGTVHPNTVTYIGVLGRDGKINYYNREQFTKTGDLASPLHRSLIAEGVINRWIDALK